MLKGFDITKAKAQEVDTELLKRRISTGKAIAFTGAGFSLGTKNVLGSTPPMAGELAKKLSLLCNLEESEDLMFAADVALEYADNISVLDLLKDNYTLTSVSECHEKICKLPWKKFFTTNYDNSIELACLNIGKRIESVDLSYKPTNFLKKNNVCLHINGKIEGAEPEDLTSKIKLSDSSYLSPDSFVNSDWYYHFKKDLETASAIVFMGYSMYDMDVKKFLFENPELQEKTYFVVRDGADFKEIFTLRKYGHVLPIGVDRFSDLMKDVQKQSHEDGVIFTETLVKYEVFDTQTDFRDIDSERLFLYGDYEIEKLHDSIRRIETIPYFIKRDIIPVCLNNIKNNNNIIITGDLGNGKSIVLEMLAYELTVNGFHTYILRNNDGDYVSDLDQIIKHEGTAVIIIDNCSNHPGLIKHIFEVKADNLIYVFADRNSNDIKFNISLDFIEHNIDLLSSDEIASAVKIIDNLSTWQKFSALSTERKKRLVYEKYDAQLSLLLLGLINSPNIKTKIKQQTDLIYSNPDHKKSVFCICICEVANVEPTSSLVSEISGTNAIYHTSLRNSPPFNQIFKVNGATIKSKSSILSLSLLNNTFSDIYVRDVLLEIVERTDSIKDQDIEIKKIFKALLRFHIVERILPKNQSALDRYYEQLKYRCTWLMDSPHYWVQYAMCRLSFSDYNRAQNYLTNAYQKAETKKGSYHTDNIDTQQARLYLNQCLDHNNSSECYNLFNKAHALLVKLPNEGRKFRQVLLYKKVFDLKYQSFSKKNKTDFEQACKKLLDQTKPDNVYPINTNMVRFITSAEEALIEILNTIMLERT
ncbi:SIR2 family protein (plasmid) [Escherichia coli]|uniref:SIR2 family protein n=3 Tax=Escherichia coli TaxID=562 RepID=UPI001767F376|nr:SIR2 family protein [Escherichia coli]EFF2244543.1 SIR2 family protein [Escherichia coli]EFH8139067.1 SIR2 family protein [Escherichia coli]EFN7143348.1 SIR2 family protein [Escherichia coli]EFN7157858.1 SIR2 family protein [Escherichia coli]EFN7163093.1 SIR2 family protein [Escherichia coli]